MTWNARNRIDRIEEILGNFDDPDGTIDVDRTWLPSEPQPEIPPDEYVTPARRRLIDQLAEMDDSICGGGE